MVKQSSFTRASRNRSARNTSSGPSLDLGLRIIDGQTKLVHARLPQSKRPEHIAILGKTGQGKSYFLRHLSAQDIRSGRGFVFFDLHGDSMSFVLRLVAAEELRQRRDLSERLIVIEPGDPEFSIGLNIIENGEGENTYLQLAEFAQILKARWHLDSLGARSEELLRNGLQALADNGCTLLELAPLLTNAAFRAACIARVQNTEVSDYFKTRFDTRSEAMQAAYRDAILNKVSGFTGDVRFRHMLGQQRSTFSLLDAMDRGRWVILNLDKGRLGEQAATLGSSLLTKLKNALFSRKRRQLFTLYCDEIQNLVAFDSGLDTLLSEARKFAISVVSANQFLEQYPPQMRAAIMAVGTHIFFQLSSPDADKIASALDGGRRLAEILKNLPKRHMVVKSGAHRNFDIRKCWFRILLSHRRYRSSAAPADNRHSCAPSFPRLGWGHVGSSGIFRDYPMRGSSFLLLDKRAPAVAMMSVVQGLRINGRDLFQALEYR